MKSILLFLLLLTSICFAITNEEEARILFARALEAWYGGDVLTARENMSKALSGLIYITDIPEFWFFTSKLDIDIGAVEKALEDLKTILVIAPTKDEAVSLVKEIETFSMPLAESTPTLSQEVLRIDGFKNGVEYFYSPISPIALGRNIYIADKINGRLIEYGTSGYTVYKLGFKPESMVSHAFKQIYIAGEDKLAVFDPANGKTQIIHSGFIRPILAGFDRLGRLWGADVDRIFCFESGKLKFFDLDEFYSIQDIEVGLKGIWILDIFKNRIVLLDFNLKKILEMPAYGAWCFELTVFDEPFVLKDNAIFLISKGNLIEVGKFSEHYITMEYNYPFLITADFKAHSVHIFPFKGKEPLVVKIDSLSFEQDKAVLSVRVENIFADPIPIIGEMVQVREGGGPVFFELSLGHRAVAWSNVEKDSFKKVLPTLKRSGSYAVVLKDTKELKRTDVVSLRGKNVRIFIPDVPNEEVLLSGGFGYFKSNFEMFQPVWNVRFTRTRPIPSDIVPVKFEVRLAQEIFSDTVYYTKGMLQK